MSQTPRNRYTTDSSSIITIDDSTTRLTMPETESSEQSSQYSEYQNVPSNSQKLQSTPTTPVNNSRNRIKPRHQNFPLNTNKSPMRWFL